MKRARWERQLLEREGALAANVAIRETTKAVPTALGIKVKRYQLAAARLHHFATDADNDAPPFSNPRLRLTSPVRQGHAEFQEQDVPHLFPDMLNFFMSQCVFTGLEHKSFSCFQSTQRGGWPTRRRRNGTSKDGYHTVARKYAEVQLVCSTANRYSRRTPSRTKRLLEAKIACHGGSNSSSALAKPFAASHDALTFHPSARAVAPGVATADSHYDSERCSCVRKANWTCVAYGSFVEKLHGATHCILQDSQPMYDRATLLVCWARTKIRRPDVSLQVEFIDPYTALPKLQSIKNDHGHGNSATGVAWNWRWTRRRTRGSSKPRRTFRSPSPRHAFSQLAQISATNDFIRARSRNLTGLKPTWQVPFVSAEDRLDDVNRGKGKNGGDELATTRILKKSGRGDTYGGLKIAHRQKVADGDRSNECARRVPNQLCSRSASVGRYSLVYAREPGIDQRASARLFREAPTRSCSMAPFNRSTPCWQCTTPDTPVKSDCHATPRDVGSGYPDSSAGQGVHAPLPRPSAGAYQPPTSRESAQLSGSFEREVRSLLNKISPENASHMLAQLADLEVHSIKQLSEMCTMIFDKALHDSFYSAVYASCIEKLCRQHDMIPIDWQVEVAACKSFRSMVLQRCAKHFESFFATAHILEEKVQETVVGSGDGCGTVQQASLRQRALACIRFIGHLFLCGIIPASALGNLVWRLLEPPSGSQVQWPPKAWIECACELLHTVGSHLATWRSEMLPRFIEKLKQWRDSKVFPVRTRFIIQDVVDANENGWPDSHLSKGVPAKSLASWHAVDH